LRLIVSVRDRVHLADVLRTLRRSPVVSRVSRYRQA
jgi:GTP pyrophosphokinase/guanosine-3',5'-bis(diphosphate) 3'-pyrophosphohydrolase